MLPGGMNQSSTARLNVYFWNIGGYLTENFLAGGSTNPANVLLHLQRGVP